MAIDLGMRVSHLGRSAQRLVVLQALTAALAKTRTYVEIASVIIDEALPALKAEVGVVALASEDGLWLRNVGFKGVDAATEDAWRDYPVEAPVPVAESAKTRESIIVRTIAERNARYPILAEIHGLENGGPVTAFPLLIDERLLGVLAFCWGEPLEIDDEDLAFLRTLAEQCGLAIERARLYELAEREISERKASESKLREANARKDEFLAMLGHELRNPLASIRGATDVLGEVAPRLGSDDGKLVVRVHDVLERQTAHMKRMVDDLLDVSRLVRGQLTLKLEPLDVTQLLCTSVDDYRSAFVAAGIRLEVVAPSVPMWTRADATRLAQSIANLLHNALKFSPKGSCVRVVLESAAQHAVIVVRDEGPGIDAELLPRLFEPFAQADHGLARSIGGLGIGLSLVRGLMRLHGGDVSVESAGAGSGALFRLELPLDQTAPHQTPPLALPVRPVGKRILVLEDNEDAAEMLAMLLQGMGHEVQLTHHAQDALALLEGWRADIILSDIGLPDIDGFAFARAVQDRTRETGRPRAFMVAITGYGSAEDQKRAHEAGFDAHLTKPVDARTLRNLLGEARVEVGKSLLSA